MLIDVMDFDPRITSDGQGWHCNFHLGYGHDVVLEDATNQKSCVQALQCLITKADSEINDLEDELAVLQCQLKWSKLDKQVDPYEVCCATFKQKIDTLTNSIKSSRDDRILTGDDVDTTKIQRPAERIYDIINTLTKHNFSTPKKQVKDLPNEMNSLVISGSVDIASDLRQTETTSDLSAESRELTTDLEKLVDTVSEESCSDIARYARKDSLEARVLDKTDVEVTIKVEADAYERTPEGKNGFTACLQEHNDIEHSKPNALRHGEVTEECMTGVKNSGSDSAPLSAESEMIVKVEVETSDMNIRHVVADSVCMMLDQETKDPIESHPEVNLSSSADRVEITYGRDRKKIGLSAIINPQGQKVQRKTFNGAKQANSMMRKPQGKIGKRSFSSNDLRNKTIDKRMEEHNKIEHSKSNALRHEDIEESMTGSKNSGVESSHVSAKSKMIIKVEVDNNDINIRHVAPDSLCMMLDQESKDPIEGHQEVNQSANADGAETFGRNRKKSGLSAIIKPEGRKVLRKTFNGAKQANSMMLKPKGKIGKRNFSSNDCRQSKSPSSGLEVRFHPFPKTILQRKTVNMTQSEVNFLEEEDHQGPASKSHIEMVVCLEAPLPAKEKASPFRPSPANRHNGDSKSTASDIMATKESPAYDLENLRLGLSQQPDFLHRLKLPELKSILMSNKVRRVSKLKKEKMIEELIKLLNAT